MIYSEDKKVKRKALIGLILAFVLTLGVVAYHSFVKSKSEFVYTIGLVSNFSARPKSSDGVVIKYTINNKTYQLECTSLKCQLMNLRDKVLLRIYLDDPSVYDIIYDHSKNLNSTPPVMGWKSIGEIK